MMLMMICFSPDSLRISLSRMVFRTPFRSSSLHFYFLMLRDNFFPLLPLASDSDVIWDLSFASAGAGSAPVVQFF